MNIEIHDAALEARIRRRARFSRLKPQMTLFLCALRVLCGEKRPHELCALRALYGENILNQLIRAATSLSGCGSGMR